ncbi:MAG: cyclic nucleotide-binding domain-containing protein [Alsobacter sp.]
MQNPAISVLGQTALLQDVAGETLGRLVSGAFLQHFPTDIVIQQQDVRPDFLHLVVSGTVELLRDEGDALATVDVIAAGGLFVSSAVVADSPTLVSAVTLGPSVIAFIPAARVRDALATDPLLGMALLRALASDMRGRDRDLAEMKALTAGQRLGRWVLREQGRIGLPHFPLPYAKRVLATLLGMSPENLSRSSSALVAHGVRFKGRMVEVTDAVALDLYSRRRPKSPDGGAGPPGIAPQASPGS